MYGDEEVRVSIINGPDHGQEIYNTTACGMLIAEMK
jgi:hypothetical protein